MQQICTFRLLAIILFNEKISYIIQYNLLHFFELGTVCGTSNYQIPFAQESPFQGLLHKWCRKKKIT
jgi:hypothetical protein